MRHSVAAIYSVFAAMLGACTALTIAPDVQVLGRHPFSRGEVRQIQELMAAAGVRRPISHITGTAPDRVIVYSEATNREGDQRLVFTAYRINGRWFVEKSSIRKEGMIVF
jgi:hypothetical protein